MYPTRILNSICDRPSKLLYFTNITLYAMFTWTMFIFESAVACTPYTIYTVLCACTQHFHVFCLPQFNAKKRKGKYVRTSVKLEFSSQWMRCRDQWMNNCISVSVAGNWNNKKWERTYLKRISSSSFNPLFIRHHNKYIVRFLNSKRRMICCSWRKSETSLFIGLGLGKLPERVYNLLILKTIK